MNLTLSIDERLIKEAREVARAMGKSLNQIIREYLESLTASKQAEHELQELQELTAEGGGRSGRRRIRRTELHERT